MPCQRPSDLIECSLHRNVYVPAWSSVRVTGGSPGNFSGTCPGISSVPSESGASPGLISHRSCGTCAVAGKFHRMVSPTVASSGLGDQELGVALVSTVFGALPPASAGPGAAPVSPVFGALPPASAGSVADSVTCTGPS